jgi:hypothetical protein
MTTRPRRIDTYCRRCLCLELAADSELPAALLARLSHAADHSLAAVQGLRVAKRRAESAADGNSNAAARSVDRFRRKCRCFPRNSGSTFRGSVQNAFRQSQSALVASRSRSAPRVRNRGLRRQMCGGLRPYPFRSAAACRNLANNRQTFAKLPKLIVINFLRLARLAEERQRLQQEVKTNYAQQQVRPIAEPIC